MTDFESWPASFETYQTLPILDTYNSSGDFVRYIKREGDYVKVGRGTVLRTDTSRAIWGNDITKLFSPRSEIWDFLQLFEATRGRLGAFFWVGEESDYAVEAVSSTRLDVTAKGMVSEWTYRPYVGVILADGTPVVREIDSVNRNGSTDELTLADSWTVTSSDIVRCGMARKVRFGSDTIEERWKTDQVCEIVFSLVEVQEEKTVDVSIDQPISGNVGTEQSDPAVESPPVLPVPLYAYYDLSSEDNITLNGSDLASAEDLSGNDRNLLTNGTQCPYISSWINNKGAVQCVSEVRPYKAENFGTIGDEYTVFFVGDPTGTNSVILGNGIALSVYLFAVSSSQSMYSYNGASCVLGDVIPTDPSLFVVRCTPSGALTNLKLDKINSSEHITAGPTTAGSNALTDFYIAGHVGARCYLGEIGIYDYAFTDQEVLDLFEYAKFKWGI